MSDEDLPRPVTVLLAGRPSTGAAPAGDAPPLPPPGQPVLTAPVWRLLTDGVVHTAQAGHPLAVALEAAGVPVAVVAAEDAADLLRETAGVGRRAVWLTGRADDPVVTALGDAAHLVPADVPGARLLDVVAVMDRLRSPGGCPWDAEQTHASLAPYLLEEAYEAVEAIEQDDAVGLREELGDVLLQVVFHARLAEEGGPPDRWSVDDVAAGLVDKLVRRHPHVFGDATARTAGEVEAGWDAIKAAEKGRTSVTDGVTAGQPALTLAATLQRRAAAAGVPPALVAGEAAQTPGQAVSGLAAAVEETGSADAVGELLFAAVALARAHGVDPEAALRGRARRFRDTLAGVERAARAAGLDPRELDARGWHDRWAASS